MRRYDQLTVAQLMTTEIIALDEDASLEQAEEEMLIGDFRHLPVIDGEARVVGILSNRDLSKALGAIERRHGRVQEVMSADVLTVHPESRACEATALMLDHKIGALPVVNGEARLVGIVTETDLLRFAHQVLGGASLAVDE